PRPFPGSRCRSPPARFRRRPVTRGARSDREHESSWLIGTTKPGWKSSARSVAADAADDGVAGRAQRSLGGLLRNGCAVPRIDDHGRADRGPGKEDRLRRGGDVDAAVAGEGTVL